MEAVILLIVLGKLCIYLWMEFPLPSFFTKYAFFERLHSCDLCSGVWIYSILFSVFGVNLFQQFGIASNFVSYVLSGFFSSFVVHIFSVGWKEKFSVIIDDYH